MKIKNLFIFSVLLFIISCSTIETPKSKYTTKEISEIVSNKLYSEIGEKIDYKDIRLSKRGYGKWKIILYGLNNIYEVIVDEDANILEKSVHEYLKNTP